MRNHCRQLLQNRNRRLRTVCFHFRLCGMKSVGDTFEQLKKAFKDTLAEDDEMIRRLHKKVRELEADWIWAINDPSGNLVVFAIKVPRHILLSGYQALYHSNNHQRLSPPNRPT
ncbi:hypothetical protein Hypma_005903 [Hypsizygus marmoreus]|uniref:Uncharacterized protein n=1 Tax=Hypsizygus marmoreus TaxID=39966 RepID=A0A369K7V6_HYPMA|nr:hypothetical protein Hypma_005903 [Hypsizygus marmoreus]